jgi:glutathione S-transferase
MKLYYTPGSCAMAPHIAASEAGVPLDLVKVDLREHKTEKGEDYYAISPRGYVPLLELGDGTRLTEANVLVQYIADENPSAGLMPTDRLGRAKAQSTLAFIATELHKGFGPLWDPAAPAETKASAKTKLSKRFDEINETLGVQQYIGGDSFAAPDAYAFTIINWANFHQIDLKQWPNIAAYMARIAARPKVQEAMRQEGLM